MTPFDSWEGVAKKNAHKGRHILYVDDDAALVFLATRILQRGGYRVTGHTDPKAAVEAFRAKPTAFDTVVTDARMPGMSGAALAESVRGIRPDVPVVIVSAYITPEDTEAARRLGIGDVVLKPYSAQDFARILQELAAN